MRPISGERSERIVSKPLTDRDREKAKSRGYDSGFSGQVIGSKPVTKGTAYDYGIAGSFDPGMIDNIIASTRQATANIGTSKADQDEIKGYVQSARDFIKDIGAVGGPTPMEKEAQRDKLNPRFNPDDQDMIDNRISNYGRMIDQIKGKRPSLEQLSARYGVSARFGHQDYKKAREAGYSDKEILSYLDANPTQLYAHNKPGAGGESGKGGLYDSIKAGNVDYSKGVDIDRGAYNWLF